MPVEYNEYCEFCFSVEVFIGICVDCKKEVCSDCGDLNAYDDPVHFDCYEDEEDED